MSVWIYARGNKRAAVVVKRNSVFIHSKLKTVALVVSDCVPATDGKTELWLGRLLVVAVCARGSVSVSMCTNEVVLFRLSTLRLARL